MKIIQEKKDNLQKEEKRIVNTSRITSEDRKEFAEIEEHHKNETFESFKRNSKIRFNSVLDDDIIITEDMSEIKKYLKLLVLAQDYNNIDDYAKKSKLGYKTGSIKMAFAPKHNTSTKILKDIANELGMNLQIEEKKIYKIIQD